MGNLQVAFVNRKTQTFALVWPDRMENREGALPPGLACPVVDWTGIDTMDAIDAMGAVLMLHGNNAGIKDLDKMLDDLEAIGCEVRRAQ